jgi:hypothetical protein
MKRLIVPFAALALVVPATASAAPTGEDTRNAAQECRALQKAAGSNFADVIRGTTFKQRVNANGRNAFGKCVSFLAREEEREREGAQQGAAQRCQAERATDEAKFATDFRNFGECVSTRARASKAEEDEDDRSERVNPARRCRVLQRDKAEFEKAFGTRSNAFGKCVSAQARAQSAS